MTKHKNLLAIFAELRAMAKADQAMRNRCRDNPGEWDETVDQQHTKRMKEIIEEIGWPSISKVSPEGASNAWVLVQHADHDLEFQKKCLALMKAEPEGDVSKRDMAYLEDRISVSEGHPQIYGTQFHKNADGLLEPLPLFDPENVDLRRKEMGLETLAENQKRIRESHARKRV